MQEKNTTKTKRIFKNTLYMYLRMLIMLVLSLFTARIVFNTLGIDNYGIYNVVGGIIVLFTFINNGLNSATSRFITAEIANGTQERISHVFNTCILSHIFIACIIFLLAETIGLWIVNNLLNIPEDRMYAANWVFQLSVISAILSVIQSPFGATILAYEKINIYAYFTITDVIFKLLIIYLVQAIKGDKLIIYALLIFLTTIINTIMYRVYTYKKIPICRLKHIRYDKSLIKEILSFMSWSLAGQAAVVGTNQGTNVLINVYHNVSVNAAMGVSNTITNTVQGFVGNFQTAFNPQIVKSYISKEFDYLQALMIRSAKLSSYLIIIFLVPLIFEAKNVIVLWLGSNIPQYAVEFCLLTLIANYIEALAAPLWMMIYAQSNIKKYQIITSCIFSLNFFGSWLFLFLDFPPFFVIIIRIVVYLLLISERLYFTKVYFKDFNYIKWTKEVIIKSCLIIAASSSLTFITYNLFNLPLFFHIAYTTCISLCFNLVLIYILGLNKQERNFINKKIKHIIS